MATAVWQLAWIVATVVQHASPMSRKSLLNHRLMDSTLAFNQLSAKAKETTQLTEGPLDVRITSLDLKHVVEWTPVPGGQNLYTVEVFCEGRSEWKRTAACVGIPGPSCDASYILGKPWQPCWARVGVDPKAGSMDLGGGEPNIWTYSRDFIASRDTLISAPSVKAWATQRGLLVAVKDPLSPGPSPGLAPQLLGHALPGLAYLVTLWHHGTNSEDFLVFEKSQFELLDLEPGSTYCLKVQISPDGWEQLGEPSRITCVETQGGTHSPDFLILAALVAGSLVILGVLLTCFGVALRQFFRKRNTVAPLHSKHPQSPSLTTVGPLQTTHSPFLHGPSASSQLSPTGHFPAYSLEGLV
uniref:interleukin-20 receptor subunit alpha-like n=1 Tax=Myxine glutinosa TaxID=7769 RepID=UPI00358F7C17